MCVCRGVELGQCVQFVETFDDVLSFRRAAGQDLTVIFSAAAMSKMPASGGMLFDFIAVGRPNANSAMQNVGFWGCIVD